MTENGTIMAVDERRIAITRAVSPSIVSCELTHLDREPIDVARASAQHEAYERLLEDLGCTVVHARPEPSLPDAVFVEDTAVVLEELAVIARPGAESRRAETETITAALRPYLPLVTIAKPGTIDGGDVLRVGSAIFVGRSGRTNDDGIRQLRDHVSPFGYSVHSVVVRGCLHLKSAVTAADENTLVMNPEWIDRDPFAGYSIIETDPAEPNAANVLRIGTVTICAAAFPRTRERIARHGIETRTLDVSEIAKAEGALTCCSIVFRLGDGRS